MQNKIVPIIIAAAVIGATFAAYVGWAVSATRINKLIDERLAGNEFDDRVEKGIVAYIDKQKRQREEEPSRLAKNVPPPSKEDHVYGNPGAVISLIEYSDFECPYCKRFHPIAKELVDKSGGQINWIYRHYPLPMHMQTCFAYLGYKTGDFPVSERLADQSLALPVYPELTPDDIMYVVQTIKEFYS